MDDLAILMPAMARRAWAGLEIPTIRLGDWEWPNPCWYKAKNIRPYRTVLVFPVFEEIPTALRAAIREWCQTALPVRPPTHFRTRDLHLLQAMAVEIGMFPPSHPEAIQVETAIPPSPDPHLDIDWRAILIGLTRGITNLGRVATTLQEGVVGPNPIRAPAPKIRPRPIGPAEWPEEKFDSMSVNGLPRIVPSSPALAIAEAAWWLDWMGWDIGSIAQTIRQLRAAIRRAERAWQEWHNRADRLHKRQAARLEALVHRARRLGVHDSGWSAIELGMQALAERILQTHYAGAPLPPGLRRSARPADDVEGFVDELIFTDGPAAGLSIDDFQFIAITCGWQAGRLEAIWKRLEKALQRMKRSIKDRK